MAYTQTISYLRRFFTSTWGIAFAITLGWQIAMTLFGYIADLSLGHKEGDIVAHTAYWDGGWYMSIIGGAYGTDGAAPVFYPLFPFIVKALHMLCMGVVSIPAVGLLVNILATWFATVALVKISEFYVPGSKRWLPFALFITSPAAIFLHLFYAEAVFCAVVFWAYLFALRRQWHWMAIMLAISTAAKLPALLFIGLCGLEFMRTYGWNIKKIRSPRILWFLLAPLGFVAYGLYLYVIRGDFLAMFHGYDATDDWGYHQFNPNFLETIARTAGGLAHVIIGDAALGPIPIIFVNQVLPLAGLIILGVLSVYALIAGKKTVPLGIFGLVSVVFFTLNSNVISVHRYLLPCLVIYIMAAVATGRIKAARPVLYAALYIGALLQAFLIILFVSGYFAG